MFLLSIYIILVVINKCLNQCININTNSYKNSEYYLVAPCHRSTLKVITSINYVTLEDCKVMAMHKKGMGINFSAIKTNNLTENNGDVLKTCMVLSCPEIENSTSLIPDSRFNYYSIYANPIPPPNSTCVEGVGVFVYHLSKSNYTVAKQTCLDFGAKLADVGAESRTNALSQHLAFLSGEYKIREIYVGMDDIEIAGRFKQSNGNLLECSNFRAWAPGHPKQKNSNYKCVVLDVNRMWRTVICDKLLSFICEIIPDGWISYDDYFETEICIDVESFIY